MTDQPNDAADQAANATEPEGHTPAADPDLAALAALVKGSTPTDGGADAPQPEGDAEPVADASPEAEPDADFDTVPVGPVVPVAAAVAVDEPKAGPHRRRSLFLRFGMAFVVGLLLAVGVGAGGLYAWARQYDDRVLPGVSVGNTELGGLNREQAQAALANAYGYLGEGEITLKGPDGETTTISYADIGRGPDTEALLDLALAAGRQGAPLVDLIGRPEIALHGMTLDSAVTYDKDKLAAAVAALAATIDETPVDATATAEAGVFSSTESKDGRAVDQAALVAALDPQLAALSGPASIALDVPVTTLAPAVNTRTVLAATEAAKRMSADVIVARGEEKWKIAGAEIAPLISFTAGADGTITPVLDQAGLDPLVAALAPKVKQEVREAGLKLVGGKVIATGRSREGRTLTLWSTKEAIVTEIGARQAGTAAQPVQAVVRAVPPKLSSADAKAFAPKMKMISDYSVYYWVIINNHWGGNIEGPATVINGTVVPAGEKFDFWKVVGDLRNAPGVGPGNAIEGGKITVTGAFGGGICTTSTTLFNAAFRAGMIPLARKNHNEFIDRYPAGLDATVWIIGKAKQTMSFRNDTPYPILITRTVTGNSSKRWLTFKIWSVPNGRKATVTNTVIQPGEKAVHKTVYDPTKPVGYRFFNNAAVNGAKVWTTVSIYDHGKLHFRKRYFSNYPAVDGVTVVGTKRTAT